VVGQSLKETPRVVIQRTLPQDNTTRS
jgi:hypothetical protein